MHVFVHVCVNCAPVHYVAIVIDVVNATTIIESDGRVTVVITTSGGVSVFPITLTVTTVNGTANDGECTRWYNLSSEDTLEPVLGVLCSVTSLVRTPWNQCWGSCAV